MSLITRCPSCQTLFKVVPDQLRVSEGWVRCGQCSEIFDASVQLVNAESDEQAVRAFEQAPVATAPQLQTASGVVPGAALHGPAEVARTGPPPPEERTPAQTPAVPAPSMSTDFAAIELERQELLEPQWGPEPAALLGPVGASAADAVPLSADVSFLRRSNTGARWRRPWVRALLGVACLLLLGALGVQVLLQERDRIAAMYPQTLPVLGTVCAALNCRIAALRDKDAVAIESSSLVQLRTNTYRLGLVLKNAGPLDLAMPAIELTLTDQQDQPVLRRVLLPSDFAAPGAPLPAASESSLALALAVRPSAGQERVAGYRVLAFYP